MLYLHGARKQAGKVADYTNVLIFPSGRMIRENGSGRVCIEHMLHHIPPPIFIACMCVYIYDSNTDLFALYVVKYNEIL